MKVSNADGTISYNYPVEAGGFDHLAIEPPRCWVVFIEFQFKVFRYVMMVHAQPGDSTNAVVTWGPYKAE